MKNLLESILMTFILLLVSPFILLIVIPDTIKSYLHPEWVVTYDDILDHFDFVNFRRAGTDMLDDIRQERHAKYVILEGYGSIFNAISDLYEAGFLEKKIILSENGEERNRYRRCNGGRYGKNKKSLKTRLFNIIPVPQS